MVSLLKPDDWPFSTDEERAAGWREPRFDRRRKVDPLIPQWEERRGAPVLSVEERRKADLTAATAEGTRLERQRIYMALVDRLWTCDSDANAVLDIVENPEDDDLPDYADDEYNGRIPR